MQSMFTHPDREICMHDEVTGSNAQKSVWHSCRQAHFRACDDRVRRLHCRQIFAADIPVAFAQIDNPKKTLSFLALALLPYRTRSDYGLQFTL